MFNLYSCRSPFSELRFCALRSPMLLLGFVMPPNPGLLLSFPSSAILLFDALGSLLHAIYLPLPSYPLAYDGCQSFYPWRLSHLSLFQRYTLAFPVTAALVRLSLWIPLFFACLIISFIHEFLSLSFSALSSPHFLFLVFCLLLSTCGSINILFLLQLPTTHAIVTI